MRNESLPSAGAEFLPQRRDLLLLRLYYLVWIGGGGFIAPFLTLFYERRGLSGSEIGLLSSIAAFVTLISAPLVTRGSSGSSTRRSLQAFLFISAVTLLLLSQQTLFLWFAVIVAVRAFFGAGIAPLSDQTALAITGATRAGFGSVRVWGSIGWAIMGLLSGLLIERTGFFTGFAGSSLALCASAVLLGGLPLADRSSTGRAPKSAARPLLPVLPRASDFLAQNRSLVGLGIVIVLLGFGSSGVAQFEPVYFSQLGAGESVIGLSGMFSSLVEIPGMFFADRVIQKRGPALALSAAMLLNACLRGLVLLFPTVLALLVARAVTGISFSLYTVGLVKLISQRAPGDRTAAALAFFTLTLTSLVNFVSAPLSGLLFDRFGAYWLYAIAMAGYILSFLVLHLARE